jgi:exopolyphosphatase/guanosine-5'-triphosphate,3'-diphosphate pyrophosphatase
VAQIEPEHRAVVLEEASRGLLLGKDTFASGKIGSATTDAVIRALEGFRRIMEGYGVQRVRAVATSAVREAENSDTFVDRVRVRTGINIEIIDGSEESRLTYLATRERLIDHPVAKAAHAVLVEVGGGSADLTRLERMQPKQSGVYPLGAIRLRQSLASWHGRHEQRIRLLNRQIINTIDDVVRELRVNDATEMIALGSDIRFAAKRLVDEEEDDGVRIVGREALLAFVAEIEQHDEEALVQRFRLSQVDAETLVPAMLVYRSLLLATSAPRVVVPDVSLRAGVLVQLAGDSGEPGLVDFDANVVASAETLGEKYRYDSEHAHVVAHLSVRLFDELAKEHDLGARDRLLLQVAALLHDIGLFVGMRGHHKHSQYLLEQADIFGLSRDDIRLIANIARYHRRAVPGKTHIPFMALHRSDRVRVNKLAAILRFANALDAEHLQKVRDLRVETEDNGWIFTLDGTGDLTMECLVSGVRADLLKDVFGKRMIVRTTGVA